MKEDYIHPFIEFVNEDKSRYPKASSVINPVTHEYYIDPDDDFLIGDSGGFLMNISFKFQDTDVFSKVAKDYDINKRYCVYPKGSPEFVNFWSREKKRRRDGMKAMSKVYDDGTIKECRITGKHYGYLNYSRINRTPNDKEKAEQLAKGIRKPRDVEGFPRFWDADYWYFKVREFAEVNELNQCNFKARRKGYSYKEGWDSADEMNLNADVTIVLAAYDIDYLTEPGATADMTKKNLDWLEDKTNWKRYYLSEKLDSIELGYKKSSDGNKKYGYRSKCISVSTYNNESAAIGKKAVKIKFEEAGKFPNLQETLNVTLSNAESGDNIVGNIAIWGTAGTKNANWAPAMNIFFNPSNVNRIMGFENVWDENARATVCGFFHPNIWAMEDSKFITMDIHGNSNLEAAYETDNRKKEEARKTMILENYIVFCGQRANSPSEAFNTGSENIFSDPMLNDHYKDLMYNPDLKFWKDGILMDTNDGIRFRTNEWLQDNGYKSYAHPYIDDFPFNPKKDFKGCIRQYFAPFRVEDNVPTNLYGIVIDPVGVDKDAKDISIKHSLCCIQVYLLPNIITPMQTGGLVAQFIGRNESMAEDSEIALKLAKYYNAKRMTLAEINRGTVVNDFKRSKALEYLMYEPKIVWDNKADTKDNRYYGINITPKLKEEGIKYLRDWLYTTLRVKEDGSRICNLHYIKDIGLIKELLNFNNKGNFDRISCAILYMYLLSYVTIKPKQPNTNSSNNKSIYQQIYN